MHIYCIKLFIDPKSFHKIQCLILIFELKDRNIISKTKNNMINNSFDE